MVLTSSKARRRKMRGVKSQSSMSGGADERSDVFDGGSSVDGTPGSATWAEGDLEGL